MSDGFKLSIFGNDNSSEKKRGKKAPGKHEAKDTAPKADPIPVAEVVTASPEPASVSNSLSASDPLLVSGPPAVTPSAAELEAFFPSETMASGKEAQMNSSSESTEQAPATITAADVAAQARIEERRRKRRARISTPVRVRSLDVTGNGPDEITTTVNISRIGILIETAGTGFFRSMPVAVVLPYAKTPGVPQAEQEGRVVRVSELPDGRRSVAVALGMGAGDLVSTSGRKLGEEQGLLPPRWAEPARKEDKFVIDRAPGSEKPLVLTMDAESAARDSIKDYLTEEGYDVIAVGTAGEAREALNMFTPALVIAAIEGEGMPGYDICAHCKATPRLQRIPVMLMTSSAYPSDYSSAHSVGAVVCMAKPYKQERLGHVVRLLAPPPNANNEAVPVRPPDPTRRHVRVPSKALSTPSSSTRLFRFGSKS